MSRRRRRALALLCAIGASACAVDSDECELDAARSVVHDSEGRPAYEGQALTMVSCANGTFCHSPAAQGVQRYGVPKGFDFDVGLVCGDTFACPEDAVRLARSQRTLVEYARPIVRELDRGTMPPGGAGGARVDEVVAARAFRRADGTSLPSARSAEGRRVMANWLACGAPVVETSDDADDLAPGDYCGPGPNGIGDCVVERPLVPGD